jgi:hypothetical protein
MLNPVDQGSVISFTCGQRAKQRPPDLSCRGGHVCHRTINQSSMQTKHYQILMLHHGFRVDKSRSRFGAATHRLVKAHV